MTIPFWIVAGFLAYALVGFPLLVLVLGAILRRRHRCSRVTPRVSFLIAAYNETEAIAAKVRNALDQHYPSERIQVVVVDDGSTDGTADAVAAIDDGRVRLVRLTERGGKIGALNRAMAACDGEVVVLTDANAVFEPDALAELVSAFADPTVGGVCGNQLNRPGRSALAVGERIYWEYDKLLKRMESRTGSIVAADGSIYALRREHLEPIPPGVTDDFFLSTGVVRDGARLVFHERARSIESPLERGGDHFRRRVRITQQALESLVRRRSLLNPFRHGVYSLVLFGHKVARRAAAPAILLLLPLTVLAAPSGDIYRLALVLQLAFYALALASLAGRGRTRKLLAAPAYVVLGIVATTVGIARFLGGQRSLMWEPVRR